MNDIRLYRQQQVREILGNIGDTKFKKLRAEGIVPPPDGWLGERSPFWTGASVQKILQRVMGTERPIPSSERDVTRPRVKAGSEAA